MREPVSLLSPKALINRLNIVSWSAENLLSHARANVKKILRRMVKIIPNSAVYVEICDLGAF